jgi:broad specificity phosphatase PhoE
MTKLIIIRHGNTFDKGDIILRVGCRTNLPLSTSGQTQAQKLGLYLKEVHLLPDTVITAPLLRSQQTATLALTAASYTCPTQIRDELSEIDHGPDEGKPEVDVVARLGTETLAAWDEQSLMPNDWSPRPEQITQNWQKLLNDLRDDQGQILWLVTSNGTARFLPPLCTWACPQPNSLKLATCGTAELEYNGASWQINSWNHRAP